MRTVGPSHTPIQLGAQVPEPEARPTPAPTPAPPPAVRESSRPIAAPPVRAIVIDERVLSDSQMFDYGYKGWTDEQIAEELEATIRWLVMVWKAEPWLEKEYHAGIKARGAGQAVAAEKQLYEMVQGVSVTKETINKTTGEKETLTSMLPPNMAAIEKVLESRAPARWGKKQEAPVGTVNNTYIQAAQVTLDNRKAGLAALEQEAAAYGEE